MAKFVYKMQNILDVKLKLESQAKTAFALEMQKLREEELKLQNIYDDISRYEQKLREASMGKLDPLEMNQCNNGIEIKKNEAIEQKESIKKAERNVELARGKLNRVMVERKTQETLREKAFEEFVKEINYQEMKEVDENVSFKYSKEE